MLISKKQAADRLGVTAQRVQQLIQVGKLNAKKIGHGWIVDDTSIKARLRKYPKMLKN